MWAEGFCNDVTIFSIISSSSAHIFRKLPTYLEKPHIRGCHQQLWSSPLSSLFRPLLTPLKCTDFGLISSVIHSSYCLGICFYTVLQVLEYDCCMLFLFQICGQFSENVGRRATDDWENGYIISKPLCPHIRKIAHISGKASSLRKNSRFGREKRFEIIPIFLYGPVTYHKSLFRKKLGSDWSTLALEGPNRIYTRI